MRHWLRKGLKQTDPCRCNRLKQNVVVDDDYIVVDVVINFDVVAVAVAVSADVDVDADADVDE